jgi:uncharacterized membrane protein YhaH (DUF805 family)
MSILGSFGHNLRRLHDFTGRESRAQFWPWAIFLFILAMIADLMLVFSMIAEMMTRMIRFMQEHPKYVPGEAPFKPGDSPLPPELMPDMGRIMLPMQAVNLVFVLLIAAAVWRRLHDRDRTGAWALAYLPFLVTGAWIGQRYAGAMTFTQPPDPRIVSLLTLNSLSAWLVIVLLVVQLASRGTPGPNRFGDEPPIAV